MIGVKNNRLTVLEVIKKHNRGYLKCQCECGNVKDIKISHFKSGLIKSCGCYNKEVCKARKGCFSKLIKPDNYAAKYRVYKSYEKHAIGRKLEFDLSISDFLEITQTNCFYCNREPRNNMSGRQSRSNYTYNGIDRADNNKGYVLNNCVPCCKICNVAKLNMTLNDFVNWIKEIRNNMLLRGYDV